VFIIKKNKEQTLVEKSERALPVERKRRRGKESSETLRHRNRVWT